MRIVTFTSLFPTAQDPQHCIFVYQRCAHLAQLPETEVIVFSPVPYVPRWLKAKRWKGMGDLAGKERIGALTVYRPRYFLLPKIWMPLHALTIFLGSLALLRKLNKDKAIDCIDSHFVYPDGMAAVFLGKCLKVPVVVSARGTDINVYPKFRLIRSMIRWTLSQAEAVVAVSEALKREMTALGTSSKKIQVISNGIDAGRFHPVQRKEARRRLNLSDGDEILVSVAALIPSKGHELVIRAFARLAEHRANLQLYILGEGPHRASLERLIEELGVQGRIHLPGKRPNEELCFWFSAADASCLASQREGWPNVVTESLACGTPVVATPVGGVPEIIHSPELGILAKETPEHFAEGLDCALTKTWDQEAISKATLARTWQVVAEEVRSVLSEQVRKHREHKTEKRAELHAAEP